MKVDYSKFPDIPPGYSTNYNKIRNVYQVYRDYRVIDESLGKTVTKRETIGQIKDGKFTYSKLYLARKKNAELEQKLTSSSQQRHDKSKELAAKLNKAVKETQLDQRQQAKVIYPIEPIVLAALGARLPAKLIALLSVSSSMKRPIFSAACIHLCPSSRLRTTLFTALF